MTKSTYRPAGGGQVVVILATLVALAAAVTWILVETGVLPAVNRFL
ncbi:MAG TPA: hypothetical protein VNQ48_06135 [Microbacteriaceae bacterium]|nr:hypothetical protein [Microbacteriaceae bacterium]